jgi:intraflagellar transport protein 172
MFEGSLSCYKCKNKHDVCVLTGYPIIGGDSKRCKSCGKWGEKDAWTIFLQNFASCPWCNNPPN